MRAWWIRVAVFVSGVVTLAVEFLGQRMLSPRFGDTIDVWGITIAAVLVAIAVGTAFGGRLADRLPYARAIGPVLLVSCALLAACALVGPPILDWLSPRTSDRVGALLGALVVIVPGCTALSLVTPMAVRVSVREDLVGRAAGDLSALATLGAVLGSIITPFWLIGLLPVPTLMLLCAVPIGLLAMPALVRSPGTAVAAVMGLGFIAVVAALPSADTLRPGDRDGFGTVRAVVDSRLARIVISDDDERRAMYFDRPQVVQSLIDRDQPHVPASPYIAAATTLVCPKAPRRVLMIGLGGGALLAPLRRLVPDVQVDAVELDPQVIRLAREWMGVRERPGDRFVAGDGRRFLQSTDRRYDLIYVDAFSGDRMPPTLATTEFARLASQRLRPGGVLAFNVLTVPEAPLTDAIAASARTSFPQLSAQEASPRRRLQNVLLRTGPLPQAACVDRVRTTLGVPDLEVVPRELQPREALTDAEAPVDQLAGL
ncbi:spermidine synthase [Patulibacter sp.]|uniref:spermidine synthase n=1 Tax=Patulibacter sp. TaxID=1912859 RepID=UPI00271DD2A6|nr:fused MFS/spermidine synthase [Patulibacter sp.]MDO9410429.1 fused MFS/spermidine synthase [Patulibacter sp.]